MRIRTTVLLVGSMMAFAVHGFAQKFTVDEQSKYRIIDPSGATIDKYYAKFVMPDIGVGITIFSTQPLPRNQDAAYSNVKTSFSAAEILAAGFHARDFLPGRAGDLIKHIETKNPGYKFTRKYTRIEYTAPDGKYEKMEAEDRLNPTTLLWSSRLTDLHPTSDYPNFPVIQALKSKPGKHVITTTTYLVFTTGEFKLVSEMRDGVLVTEKVPGGREVAIAHGKATITN